MIDRPSPKQWEPRGLVPMAAGLYWLLAQPGWDWLLWAMIPGCLLLASGVAMMFMVGEHRLIGLMALGAMLGVLLSPVAWVVADFGAAFYAVLVSVASFLVAGRVGLANEPLYAGAPAPVMSTETDAKAALDEAMLGYFVCSARLPNGDIAERMCDNAKRLDQVLSEQGWYDDGAVLHPAPPPPEQTYIEPTHYLGWQHEILRFDSGYQPRPELPGSDDWGGRLRNNGQCHVRVFRHAGEPRPWLLCIHGYRMGMRWTDLSLFSPQWLHQRLGLNVIQPVLPLHGPRRIGFFSGDRFLDGDMLHFLHAEAQALWDLRRTLAWLRHNEPGARIGVFGISLGGYNAALLAGHESELDFVVAGVPLVDIAQALWRFLPPSHLHYFSARGLDEASFRRLISIVSPLSVQPLLDRERLHILAGSADRIVLPSHPLALSRHWGVPIEWYSGSHLTVRQERAGREVLRRAMSGAGWAVQ